ncbi:hypothetical protein DL96DRAFT_1742199 [Flagelloscypha sp. PMI_526]|nr:hypothetical protein DL96DRAFT_1742199 [Flagelloscypha sp. PMI_526]
MDWTDGCWRPNLDTLAFIMLGTSGALLLPDTAPPVRSNCVFHVNQKKIRPQRPELRQKVGSDHHTLYDAYDLEAAFGLASGSTRQDAVDLNLERERFRATSAAFASLFSGPVYLVVDPDEIWDGAIWVTDELPALLATGQITEIVEFRPEDIRRAYEGGSISVSSIPMVPYRGGQPNGSTPPRNPDLQQVVTSDWNVCPGHSYTVLDSGETSKGDQASTFLKHTLERKKDWLVNANCPPQEGNGRTEPGQICESPLMTCDGSATCPPECERGSPVLIAQLDPLDRMLDIAGADQCGESQQPQQQAGGDFQSNGSQANVAGGAATLSISGAVEDSGSLSHFSQWIPIILGLLSGNMLLTLILAGFAILDCIRGIQTRKYAPITETRRYIHWSHIQERRGYYTDEQYEK